MPLPALSAETRAENLRKAVAVKRTYPLGERTGVVVGRR